MKKQYIAPEAMVNNAYTEEIMQLAVNSAANHANPSTARSKEAGSVDWGEDE